MDVRKRGTPTRADQLRVRENVEIIELGDLENTPSKRRIKSSSRRRMNVASYALFGATALFGVSTIGILATRKGGVHIPESVHLPTRRRLGLQPSPEHHGEGPVHAFTLADSTRDELYRESISLRVDSSNLEDLESFIEECKEIVQSHISLEFRQALRQLHNASCANSAVLFHNLPVDPHVPPTPTDGSLSLGMSTYVAECMLVGFGELTGAHVIGYAAETAYSNPWIHEGFPRNSAGSALTKASELSFHQDMSYHPEVPDILGLVSIREGYDKQVQTELLDNRAVFEMLPPEIVKLLREPRFQIKTSDWVDASFDISAGGGRPILLDAASLAIPVDWENMVGNDPDAQFAVELLKRAILEAPKNYIHFAPGDLLLFNNRRVVHARTPYKDLRFDGGDRVLNRAYFRKDVTKEERKTRMI